MVSVGLVVLNTPPVTIMLAGAAALPITPCTFVWFAAVAAPLGKGRDAAVIGNVPPVPVTSQAVVFAVLPG